MFSFLEQGVLLVAKKQTKRQTKSKSQPTPDDEVKICRRRGDRRAADEEAQDEAPAKIPARKKVQRRRQIDPTTCERDYTNDEIEFMHALDEYKRANGRMFPTCSEVLEVVRNLGYAKVSDGSIAPTTEIVPESDALNDDADFEGELEELEQV